MMMGADYYQTESEIASLLAEGKVPIGVGQNTKIRLRNSNVLPQRRIFSAKSVRNEDFRFFNGDSTFPSKIKCGFHKEASSTATLDFYRLRNSNVASTKRPLQRRLNIPVKNQSSRSKIQSIPNTLDSHQEVK